jgi:hypothetical protein
VGARGRLVEVRTHLPEAPPECQDFFAKALNTDHSQRHTSAVRFFTELQAVVAGMPETTTP